jgi:hypothetical protein
MAFGFVWLRSTTFAMRFDFTFRRLGFVLLALLVAFRRFFSVLRESFESMLQVFARRGEADESESPIAMALLIAVVGVTAQSQG